MSISSFDAATNTEKNAVALHVYPLYTPGTILRSAKQFQDHARSEATLTRSFNPDQTHP
jgi:hypothetical protein